MVNTLNEPLKLKWPSGMFNKMITVTNYMLKETKIAQTSGRLIPKIASVFNFIIKYQTSLWDYLQVIVTEKP